MNVYIEATFDTSMAVDGGESLVHWFRAVRSRLFDDLAQAEANNGDGVVSRVLVTKDIDGSSHHFSGVGENWQHFEECLATFPWWVGFNYQKGDSPLGWARAEHVFTDGSLWQASAAVSLESPDDAESCARLVTFLRQAVDGSNPAFGRIELDNFNEYTNLDAALRRRRRRSLKESRQVLRGYAWVTVCPSELSARLGGVRALEASGVFHRVIPLRSEGVLLQASETLAGYTDAVMARVFEVLAPVLPEGEPHPDPAHPNLRFVSRDAASVR